MKRAVQVSTCAALALTTAVAGSVSAQEDWPTQPIRIIVPYAAGGNNDRIARTLSEPMSQTLGVPVVVENRGGAGGTVATGEVANADADGYTVVMCEIGTMAINPHVYSNLTYDPVADFEPVVQITSVPLVLGVGPQLGVTTIEDFLSMVRTADPEIAYASSGVGSAQHLAFEQLRSQAGFEALQIPYNGAAPARTALISGEVGAFLDGTLIPSIQNGEVTALAVTGDERLETLPDVPTFAEAGVEGVDFTSWHGFCVPDGTDDGVVSALNEAVNAAISQDNVQDSFDALNIGLVGGSPDEFRSFIESQYDTLGTLVEETGAAQQ
ncbi:tripartite tricarboxylate transporter substrate binding protein [uncultured Jannaschia sp.]|uniref:Bug family tripartite tricarboxylate transporter substrate binding protein n=1 Tax=uncultured Jannaschia sp. TaxID=293347 RepID=UPI00263772ED|nr:tripartite tricarboxylate transporter substrate binding protein [uncultured Jannaschia sp.]